MFSPLRSNKQSGASHFAACRVQYLDDAGAAPAGTPYPAGPPEPARLSIAKPREQPAKNGRHGQPGAGAPKVPVRPAEGLPLPGSKLLKAWRAARK